MGITGIVSLAISDGATLRRFLSYPGDSSEEEPVCLSACLLGNSLGDCTITHPLIFSAVLSFIFHLTLALNFSLNGSNGNNFTDHNEDEFH